jgi:hypothetical protein
LVDFDITLRGIREATIGLSPNAKRARMLGAMEESTHVLRDLAAVRAPVDLGNLRGQIFAEIHGTPTGLHGTIGVPSGSAVARYAGVMEYGRRPGSAPPPTAALIPWVLRHGMPVSAAYPIARAIGRRGLRGHFFFQFAVDHGGALVQGIFQRAVGRWP